MLDDFDRWLRTSLDKLSRKSDTAAAIQYELNRRQALLHYCDDGIIEINNSACPAGTAGVAIGRSNYLTGSSNALKTVVYGMVLGSMLAYCWSGLVVISDDLGKRA